MVKMDAIYTGQKHCEIKHEPSGARISTDAPRDNQGLGQAFSPTDLVAAALATCILTTIGILADRDGFSIEGAQASVIKEMQAHPRKIARLPLVLHLPRALTEVQRKKCENAALTCPVHKSLDPSVEKDISFIYDI